MRSAWAVPKNKARQIRRKKASVICGRCPFPDGHVIVRSVVSSLHSPPVIPNRGAMRLIGLAVVLALGLALAAPVAEAQQTEKIYRVGLLTLGTITPDNLMWSPFLDAMRQLGYMEGRNLVG